MVIHSAEFYFKMVEKTRIVGNNPGFASRYTSQIPLIKRGIFHIFDKIFKY